MIYFILKIGKIGGDYFRRLRRRWGVEFGGEMFGVESDDWV